MANENILFENFVDKATGEKISLQEVFALRDIGGAVDKNATKLDTNSREISYFKMASTNKFVFHTKLNNSEAITVAFEGDSLTYGFDTRSADTKPGINGSSATRSATPYPDGFMECLRYVIADNGPVGVPSYSNRGYPGDTSTDGLDRWAEAQRTDLCLISYGTNDANGYGGRTETIEKYEENMHAMVRRRLDQGSYVVLVVPPLIEDTLKDRKMRRYVDILQNVAETYGIPLLDATDQTQYRFQAGLNYWNDGVHLSAQCYHDWGWNLVAALMGHRYGLPPKVYRGTKLYFDTGAHLGGSVSVVNGVPTGKVFLTAEGEFLTFGIQVNEPVTLKIGVQGDHFQQIRATYAAGKAGTPNSEFQHNARTTVDPIEYTMYKLYPGYRIVHVTSIGGTSGQIVYLGFD